jgi:large subunit ribosomal protein L9
MSTVQVILLDDLPHLGKLGDVVKVRRGHARNHLLPTGKAQTYSEAAYADFAKRKKQIIQEQKKKRSALEQFHGELDGYTLQIVMQAREDGQLYGSISQAVVVDQLHKEQHEIKRSQVILPEGEPIKSVGEHEVQIRLNPDLIATIRISVLAEKPS